MFSQSFFVVFLTAASGWAPDFQPASYPVRNNNGVAAADFNGDGRSDVVVTSDAAISVLPGDGQGEFQSPIVTPMPIGFVAWHPDTGDFDGDGVADLIVFYQDSSMAVTGDAILYGNGDGSFQSPSILTALDSNWHDLNSVAVGDVNGDGLTDICHVFVYYGGDGESWGWGSSVVSLLNLGNGNFQAGHLLNGPYAYTRVQFSDMNGDGLSDIVAQAEGARQVALSRGDGTFIETGVSYPGGWFTGDALAIGHFNADSTRNVVSLYVYNFTYGLVTHFGNGDGTLSSVATSSPGDRNITKLVADVDGDGRLDVFGADAVGAAVYFGDGAGRFGYRRVCSFEVASTNIGMATTDFNGDGRPDLALTPTQDAVVVLLNDGNWTAPVPPRPVISIADVAKTEGSKGTTKVSFQVTLSSTSNETVTVSYRTADGTATIADGDYSAANGTLTFSPGQTSRTITVQVRSDRKREADETFYVDLFGPSANATIGQSRGTGTIVNDD